MINLIKFKENNLPIQNFCKNCPHRKIPQSMKHKFNAEVKLMFLECPMNDSNVIGCYIKNLNIDWKAFSSWLKDNGQLDETEEKTLKLLKIN